MKTFLLNFNNNYAINLFSFPHLLLIVITFIIFILILNKRKRISELNPEIKKRIRIILGCILIVNIIIRRGSFIYYGVYNWRYHLDINFCNFTSLLFILYTLSGNKKILNIIYYMSFIGPLTSIILPSSMLQPLGYSFYSFILIHHVIFLAINFFVYIENIEWNKKNKWYAMEFLIIYYVVIQLFNYFFETSYNKALTFVNDEILRIDFFYYLSNYSFIVTFIYIGTIAGLIFLADFIIKKTTNKNIR